MDGAEQGPLILVVEDDPDNGEVIEITLTEFGSYRVVVEASGARAMERIQTLHPDLVLLDLLLPERSGLEILRELRADPVYRDLPVIAVSANIQPGLRHQIQQLGCDDFVAKPFSIDQLLMAVKQALGRHAEPDRSDNDAPA